jgi:hypothetical protein
VTLVSWRCAPLAVLLLFSAVALAQEPLVVTNDSHEVNVLRVAKTNSLHGGMVRPPSPAEAYLLAYLETDDPCFDPGRNAGCFDGEFDEIDTIAWACGEIEISEDDIRPADGGGLLDGELACSYLIPVESGALTLHLRGYPPIDVAPQ